MPTSAESPRLGHRRGASRARVSRQDVAAARSFDLKTNNAPHRTFPRNAPEHRRETHGSFVDIQGREQQWPLSIALLFAPITSAAFCVLGACRRDQIGRAHV